MISLSAQGIEQGTDLTFNFINAEAGLIKALCEAFQTRRFSETDRNGSRACEAVLLVCPCHPDSPHSITTSRNSSCFIFHCYSLSVNLLCTKIQLSSSSLSKQKTSSKSSSQSFGVWWKARNIFHDFKGCSTSSSFKSVENAVVGWRGNDGSFW